MKMKIEVSNGEIVDKLTILEIKRQNAQHYDQARLVEEELNHLQDIVERLNVPDEMVEELRVVNQKIWDMENSIRLCEKNNQFDEIFIQNARDIYYNNDERNKIKGRINKYTKSHFGEQKILPSY